MSVADNKHGELVAKLREKAVLLSSWGSTDAVCYLLTDAATALEAAEERAKDAYIEKEIAREHRLAAEADARQKAETLDKGARFLAAHDEFLVDQSMAIAVSMKDAADAFRAALGRA